MRLDAACSPQFARHETFYPRYGWVKKAVDAAAKDSDLFNDENAVVEIGVGKNMVRSIRYWGLAYKVLAKQAEATGRSHAAVPSTIGQTVFADGGWDPYGEFPGTHWLLHWWLLAAKSVAPVWWLAFNEFPGLEFSDEQMEQFVGDRVRDWGPHTNSIKKDVSCMLRMYADATGARGGFEDRIDCPSRELQLITATAERGVYRFNLGTKPTLPPSVAAFACLDFIARTDGTARTVTISRLATEAGGPGRALKLTEAALVDLLELPSQLHEEIEITSAAGVPQLTFSDLPAVSGSALLMNHYQQQTGLSKLKLAGGSLICGPQGSAPSTSSTTAALQEAS